MLSIAYTLPGSHDLPHLNLAGLGHNIPLPLFFLDAVDEVAHLHVREFEQVFFFMHLRHLLSHCVSSQSLQLVYHFVLLLQV